MPSAQAADLGPFDRALTHYTADGALDSQEYAALRALSQKALPTADLSLARHFLNFAAKYPAFTRMTYSYYRGARSLTLRFVFAPTYAEDQLLSGRSTREVLSKLSQNDLLHETVFDHERCGAAALLSAHYLLYGHFKLAFNQLGLGEPVLSYRNLHQAQEALYRRANTDHQPGLTSSFRYLIYTNGRIGNPLPEGEVKQAAALIGLRAVPIPGPTVTRFYDRRQTLASFWKKYPQAVFLVGVTLNEATGSIRPPSGPLSQNHFVLIFKQNNQLWLLNSGVLDNGTGRALRELKTADAQAYLYQTMGSVDALLKK